MVTMKHRWIITLFAATCLSACATTPSLDKAQDVPQSKRQELPAQTLAAGECGLFVWTADDARRFILFGKSQAFKAIWQDGASQRALKIIDQNGTPTQGQFPTQIYDNGMTLRMMKAQRIDGGTRYQGGTLSKKTADGWDSVTPVIGVSSCR